ncbi:actin cytoskeleton-regulatory complex protein pan-1-like [Panicum miliaceum]|uniref:Actin cytoskeleton-regulatory complex protein pan-1-like n=1 Tax=Panicum miliaceum TaxID=4540 RepID=A0A3L6SHG4_PANMI|nr:actin cytoskeleton-regulatory complex protein pan-1-like [Panicum miliaceum]
MGAESQSTSDFEAGQPEVEDVDFLNAAERIEHSPFFRADMGSCYGCTGVAPEPTALVGDEAAEAAAGETPQVQEADASTPVDAGAGGKNPSSAFIGASLPCSATSSPVHGGKWELEQQLAAAHSPTFAVRSIARQHSAALARLVAAPSTLPRSAVGDHGSMPPQDEEEPGDPDNLLADEDGFTCGALCMFIPGFSRKKPAFFFLAPSKNRAERRHCSAGQGGAGRGSFGGRPSKAEPGAAALPAAAAASVAGRASQSWARRPCPRPRQRRWPAGQGVAGRSDPACGRGGVRSAVRSVATAMAGGGRRNSARVVAGAR